MKASPSFVRFLVSALIFLFLVSGAVHAQQVAAPPIDPKSYSAMKWRLVGPFRGGRALSVVGVPSQPNTYYFGAVAGGVWKTTDVGVSWDPLFEKQSVCHCSATIPVQVKRDCGDS